MGAQIHIREGNPCQQQTGHELWERPDRAPQSCCRGRGMQERVNKQQGLVSALAIRLGIGTCVRSKSCRQPHSQVSSLVQKHLQTPKQLVTGTYQHLDVTVYRACPFSPDDVDVSPAKTEQDLSYDFTCIIRTGHHASLRTRY